MKSIIKKCDIGKEDATCSCFNCMFSFCDSCFKTAHHKEETQSHIKDWIHYYVHIDLRCPEHNLSPMNLFCVDEKGI